MLSSTFFHELWDIPAALLLLGEKRFQILSDHAVKHGLFRMPWTVDLRSVKSGIEVTYVPLRHEKAQGKTGAVRVPRI